MKYYAFGGGGFTSPSLVCLLQLLFLSLFSLFWSPSKRTVAWFHEIWVAVMMMIMWGWWGGRRRRGRKTAIFNGGRADGGLMGCGRKTHTSPLFLSFSCLSMYVFVWLVNHIHTQNRAGPSCLCLTDWEKEWSQAKKSVSLFTHIHMQTHYYKFRRIIFFFIFQGNQVEAPLHHSIVCLFFSWDIEMIRERETKTFELHPREKKGTAAGGFIFFLRKKKRQDCVSKRLPRNFLSSIRSPQLHLLPVVAYLLLAGSLSA